jgi:2-hydroxycyclohexanecarboxyl-CoA dehydrogenase
MPVTVDLNSKVALVTGGSSGIGLGITKRLIESGADVFILDKNLETDFAKEMIKKSRAIALDVSQYIKVKEAVKTIIDEVGQIDIVINNAGVDIVKPFVSTQPEEWDFVISVNLFGVFNICHVVIPYMTERQTGKIINIASDAGKVGSSGEAVYSAAKGGVISFTKTLAREVARAKITVNCICPGPTDTPLLKTVKDENPNLVEALTKAVPLRRLGTPLDVANAVLFLASELSDYMTGQAISVSGGLSMC